MIGVQDTGLQDTGYKNDIPYDDSQATFYASILKITNKAPC